MKYIMMTSTFDNMNEALKVKDILLEKRLVSCVQISEINSFYHWKGKLENTPEIILHMKTKKILYKDVEKVILENHSYEVPQIVAYDIVDGLDSYLNWIDEETINKD